MKIIEYKKKNSTIVYRANIYLGVDQVTGKKVKTSITGRTKKEVKIRIKEAQHNFKANGGTVTKVVPVEIYKELSELWLKSYEMTVKPQTFIATKRMIHNHLMPVFGDIKLEKLSVSYI